jgi:hypothetical protein
MNIFILSENIQECAEYHCDTHVVKMIVELAQLLSTAHRVLDGVETQITKTTKTGKVRTRTTHIMTEPFKETLYYKATHANHPCGVWVRESAENYLWTYDLLVALCDEYFHRYGRAKGKHHKVEESGLLMALKYPPANIPQIPRTPFAQAMPDQYRQFDAVAAYRDYYRLGKTKLLKYTNRQRPHWL